MTHNKFHSVPVVIYDSAGNVTATGQLQQGTVEEMLKAKERILVGDGSFDTHYVEGRTLCEKAPSPVTLTGKVLSNLPNPSDIEIVDPDGKMTSYPNRAGELELQFTHRGEYVVRVKSKRFRDKVFRVNEKAKAHP